MSETHRPEEKSSVDRPRPASPATAAPQFVHFCSALSVRGCPEPAELRTAVIISLLTLTRYYCCKLERTLWLVLALSDNALLVHKIPAFIAHISPPPPPVLNH